MTEMVTSFIKENGDMGIMIKEIIEKDIIDLRVELY